MPDGWLNMAERIIKYRVPAGTPTDRADKIFAARFQGISRTRLQKAFEAGQVSFNGVIIDKCFKINQAGMLRATLNESAPESSPQAANLPLDIVFEDASVVVINKAPGMVTHPGNGTENNTLVHALLYHYEGQLSSVGGLKRPGIVHRLDKDTSGLIIIAKTDTVHHRLVNAFSQRRVYKRYTALVSGVPQSDRGTIQQPIGRHPLVRTRMAVLSKGKPARTDWMVERRLGEHSAQINCVIHTGRTHQIRVHMKELKLPLLGDTVYGFRTNHFKEICVPRVMLHSAELKLDHPYTQKNMTFQAPLPPDFQKLIQQLENSA